MLAIQLQQPATAQTASAQSASAQTAQTAPYDPIAVVSLPPPPTDPRLLPPGSVLVRLHAAALNHRDVFIRERQYPGVSYDSILGADGAGVVVAVAAPAADAPPQQALAPGDRVLINSSDGWDSDPTGPEDILAHGILGLLPRPGASLLLSVCLSFCPSVHPACLPIHPSILPIHPAHPSCKHASRHRSNRVDSPRAARLHTLTAHSCPLPVHHTGTLAEYIVVDAKLVHRAPAHLSFEELAAIPLAGLTAFRATFTLGQVKAGQSVLVPGIGGGVAAFAMQFAIAAGASVHVTSSSQEKIDRAIRLGASGGANYKDKDWVSDLQSSVESGFFDVIIDGASGPNVASYIRLLKPGGILVIYGATAGSKVSFTVPFLWFKHLQIRGACMGSNDEFRRMVDFIDEKKMRPVVSTVIDGLANVEQAFELMRRGQQFGKIVVKIEQAPNASL
ncbi:hypothetical protein BC831DRAFT_287487 [Entophlyctis helioformis]|nr:hypothetical protein BC831DRAFT_287487 [Entophlyctis helioformis]